MVLIKAGRVTVDGIVIREPWHRISGNSSVAVDGKKVGPEKARYIILNKPKGVTVTLGDRFASKAIIELIPARYGHLFPVGRLDRDSRGLIILTNDGDFCYRLTHPKFQVEKEYEVTVKGKPDKGIPARLRQGVKDEGELLKVRSSSVISEQKDRMRMSVIIAEGKKRHIRRLFRCLGFQVLDIKRVRIGALRLGSLPEGSHKIMDKDDIYRLALGRMRAID